MKGTIEKVLINKLLTGLFLSLLGTAVQAAGPLWTMVPAAGSNPTQAVLEGSTATIQYVVQNQSGKLKRLVIQPIQGIQQTTPCILAPRGQAGSSCTLNLSVNGSTLPQGGVHGGPVLCQANPDGSPNSNQCYQPSAANSLNITKGEVPPYTVTLSINPLTVSIEAGATSSTVTIKNESNTVTAEPLAFTATNVNLLNNTCTNPLPPESTCTFQVESAVVGQHLVTAQGSNTNAVSLTVNVSAVPLVNISIDSPVQQERIVGVDPVALLLLTIQNDDPVNPANNIHVSNHDNCQNLTVTPNGCDSIDPSGTCTLELGSPTPYVPCEITISGSNTTNNPTTLIAFRDGGGLVYAIDHVAVKVVAESNEGSLLWDSSNACKDDFNCTDISGATDLENGADNTSAIVAALTEQPGVMSTNFAAGACNEREGGAPGWYLPARGELESVLAALCPGGLACDFGGFLSATYSSSSQSDINFAWGVSFPFGDNFVYDKYSPRPVRCVRAFPLNPLCPFSFEAA
ncbi:MAG: DUF1566 domain-containing protein [Legionellaceae bacterium]|nr:DUF1566 domain-containing protein [Legionellaceae bacterium]